MMYSKLLDKVNRAIRAFPMMADIVPASTRGNIMIRHLTISKKQEHEYWIKAMQDLEKMDALAKFYGLFQYTPAAKYTELWVGNIPMMTDAPSEKLTNMDVHRYANGHVLIGGLGLGMIVLGLAKKKSVERITVIEKSEDVIRLVGPHIRKHLQKPLTIIHADVFDWNPYHQLFDSIYMDIWPRIIKENLPYCKELREKYQSCLDISNPKAWMGCWVEKFLLRQERLPKLRLPGYELPISMLKYGSQNVPGN